MNGTEETETAMRFAINYMKSLTLGRALLWCYLIWYLVMAAAYFDPSPRLWLTSAGLSLVIGCALCAAFLAIVGVARRFGG